MGEIGSSDMDEILARLLDTILQKKDVKAHFQPIVHLQTQQIYGYDDFNSPFG